MTHASNEQTQPEGKTLAGAWPRRDLYRSCAPDAFAGAFVDLCLWPVEFWIGKHLQLGQLATLSRSLRIHSCASRVRVLLAGSLVSRA